MNPYKIHPARCAKGKLVIQSPSDGSGFKTEVHWLAEAVGGRWVHREEGYQVTPKQAENFEKLLAAGWRGCIRVGWGSPARVQKSVGSVKFTIKEALLLSA